VRVSEAACPFCGAALPDAFRAFVPIVVPAGRRSRAALYALGTGTIAIAAACGGTEPVSTPVPHYGAAAVDASTDGPQSQPAYGGPPLVDAAYGGPPVDAAPDAPLVDAAYGGPPLDAGHDAPDAD
jgi:hypothetical protein